jgi:hypothetical protein
MELSYQELITDIRYFKYLCDEGFNLQTSKQRSLSWQDARALERLADRIVEDTGMDWALVMRGILYSAEVRNLIKHGFLTGIASSSVF